jgi:hypothetical protein
LRLTPSSWARRSTRFRSSGGMCTVVLMRIE